MATINKLCSAIGDTNLAAVIAHDLWDEWCPQPPEIDPFQYNNDHGVVVWAGQRGYVKTSESDGSGRWEMTLHSVRL